jgi:elongation factor Ts
MTTISASIVNELRQRTGAGMMDCKKALIEAEGNMDEAIDILRKKGAAKAAKRADRSASEGLAIALASDDASYGVVVEVNCETDFVAINDDFSNFAKGIAQLCLDHKFNSLEDLLAASYEGKVISELLLEKTAVIGEKIDISNYQIISGDCVVPYVHGAYRIGVLVSLSQNTDDAKNAGRDIAMQIAAMNPVAVDASGVSKEIQEKELEIGRDIAKQEGKPEAMIDKIAEGKLQKFFKENTLLAQSFVKDSSMTVENFLKSVNPDLKVVSFARLQLGA